MNVKNLSKLIFEGNDDAVKQLIAKNPELINTRPTTLDIDCNKERT